MTDARLRGAWLGRLRFDSLSDAAWRVFTSALMWSAEQGTDGMIPARYLRQLHPDGEQPGAFQELTEAGIWEPAEAGGYQMVGWGADLGQSTAAEVLRYRENARERQQRRRERLKGVQSTDRVDGDRQAVTGDLSMRDVHGDITHDASSDVTHDVTHDVGKGKGKGEVQGQGTRANALVDFDAFWDAYPRHTQREATRRAWDAFGGNHAALITAAERYAASLNSVRFARRPDLWITEQTWRDHLPSADDERAARDRLEADVRVAKTLGFLDMDAPIEPLPDDVAVRLETYRERQRSLQDAPPTP